MPGAGAREAPICRNVDGSTPTLARIARKLSAPPACAMSSVDSKATNLPSPLIDGLRLIPSSVMFVIRRSGDCMRAVCHASNAREATIRKTKSERLGRSTKVGLSSKRTAKKKLVSSVDINIEASKPERPGNARILLIYPGKTKQNPRRCNRCKWSGKRKV
jgi:hypothetical protein